MSLRGWSPIYLHSTLLGVVVCYAGLLWSMSTRILRDDLLMPDRERDSVYESALKDRGVLIS